MLLIKVGLVTGTNKTKVMVPNHTPLILLPLGQAASWLPVLKISLKNSSRNSLALRMSAVLSERRILAAVTGVG